MLTGNGGDVKSEARTWKYILGSACSPAAYIEIVTGHITKIQCIACINYSPGSWIQTQLGYESQGRFLS